MALSGKLILAWLEEDNEQRALFRVRPLLSCEGAYTQQELDQLPDEGFLRVVPDRKEQATFKERMRQLGKLCLIDLRGGIEKTRANKNYAPAKGEINRTVVYSDVIVQVPEALVYEVMPDLQGATPMTPRFCLRNGGRIQGPLCAITREPRGDQIPVAPDSDRLFAVQLPDGREKLFYWPQETQPQRVTEPVAPNTLPVSAEVPVQAEEPPEEPAKEPVKEPVKEPIKEPTKEPMKAEESVKIEEPAAPETPPVPEMPVMEPIRTPNSPRVYIPIHEVVERKRHARDDQPGAPDPVEAYRQTLEALWRSEGTRVEAVRILADMPDADALMGKHFQPAMKSLAAAALKRELEDMEAERLRLLMETDRAREDRESLFAQALEASRERAQRAVAALNTQKEATQARVGQLQAQEHALAEERDRLLKELQEAGAIVLKRPVGVSCPFEEAVKRLTRSLRGAGFEADDAHAGCLLLLLLTCPQVQLDAPTTADSVTAARAIAGALGAGVAEFPEDERAVLLPEGLDGMRVMITASGSAAPHGYTRLIAGKRDTPEDTWLEYEREPWPCMLLDARPGFFRSEVVAGPAVSMTSLAAQLPEDAPLPESAVPVLTAVAEAFRSSGAPLPLAIRQAVARFIPAAQALAGSIITALDIALSAFVIPYAQYLSVDLTGLHTLLAGFPLSLARLT